MSARFFLGYAVDLEHRLGDSSITVTLDTYGHRFPSGDDAAELAGAEKILLS